jgi:hypothetical protein
LIILIILTYPHQCFLKSGRPKKAIRKEIEITRETRYYLEVQKEIPNGIVTEKVHLTYAQAWTAYNAAQKAEVKLIDP